MTERTGAGQATDYVNRLSGESDADEDVVATFDESSAALITGRSSPEEAVEFAVTIEVRDDPH